MTDETERESDEANDNAVTVTPTADDAMPGGGGEPRGDATGDDAGDAERRRAGADPAAERLTPDDDPDGVVLTLSD